MIKINKELVQKINGFEQLKNYLNAVVDYEKEEQLNVLHCEIFVELQIMNNNFTDRDISQLIAVLTDEEANDFYLYDNEEIIEVLFPSIGKKNCIIQNAYYWIDSKSRIEWIINNVLCDNKYYEIINNINDNYLLSKEKLSNVF